MQQLIVEIRVFLLQITTRISQLNAILPSLTKRMIKYRKIREKLKMIQRILLDPTVNQILLRIKITKLLLKTQRKLEGTIIIIITKTHKARRITQIIPRIPMDHLRNL